MPESRGNNPAGADPEQLAKWQAERFAALRERYQRNRGADAALPLDMLADPEAARRAIADLG